MRILFTPQVPLDGDSISYSFGEDIIHAKVIYQGKEYKDTFDFSNVPNGELKMHDEDGQSTIQINSPIEVLLSAKRKNGELMVKLLNWISIDAKEEERFPVWIKAEDYREYLERNKEEKSDKTEPSLLDEEAKKNQPLAGIYKK